MEFEELRACISNELKRRFWEHGAMPILSRSRARIDGWLKVELAAILADKFPDVEVGYKLPKGRAAARLGGWLVDVASLPTDFAYDGTKPGFPSLDVLDLRKTIKRLRKGKGKDRAAIFFVVYPFGELHEAQWAAHKAKIEKTLGGGLVEERFAFKGGIFGRLYAGVVQEKVRAVGSVKPVVADGRRRAVAVGKDVVLARKVAVA